MKFFTKKGNEILFIPQTIFRVQNGLMCYDDNIYKFCRIIYVL